MSVNVNSITDSYNAWYDYNYGGNTRGITSDELTEIETRWSSNLGKWKVQAETDENKYEISDEETQTAREKGVQKGKDDTEHDGSTDSGKTTVSKIGVGAASLGAAVSSAVLAAGSKAGSGHLRATKLPGAFVNLGVAVLLNTLARAVKSSDPNGEQAKALTTLKDETLPEAQADIAEAQSEMDDATDTIMDLTDEANDINEDANDEIMESKSLFDTYRNSALELTNKSKSGEKLTDSEKEFLQQVQGEMQGQSDNITEVSENNTDAANDIHDEIGDYQEVYDDSAETVEEVQGLTDDYAEAFDEATLSNTETMQGVANVGKLAGYATRATGAITVATGAAKISSVIGSAEGWAMVGVGGLTIVAGLDAASKFDDIKKTQVEYGEISSQEIDVRSTTQEFNETTRASYEEQIGIYDDNLAIVEELETDTPSDLEIPEEDINTALTGGSDSTASGVGTTTGTGTTTTTTTATNNTGTTTAATGTDNDNKPDDEITV